MTITFSRRGVMAAGIVAAALPIAAKFTAAEGFPFLYEARFDLDGRLLAEARRLGLRPMPMAGLEKIALDLDPRRGKPLTGIAGVTAPAAFFIVQQITQRAGLPLRHRHGPSWAFGAIGAAPGRSQP